MSASQAGRSIRLSRRGLLRAVAAGAVLPMAGSAWNPAFAEEKATRGPHAGKTLIILTQEPFNGEPAAEKLIESWITPNELFYVRTHGTTPELDASSYRLTVEGLVETPLTLSLAELNGLPRTSTAATLTCAGNRRAEMSAIRPISGVQWKTGAIGNARWGGVRLSDLLRKAGVKESAKHVWFESVDAVKKADGKTFPFGGSIPISRAMADREEVPAALLATTMNDKPLPTDHGYPVRTVVPGYIGARSVKWLGKIVLSDRPSPNHFLAENYKVVQTSDPEEMKKADPIYSYPINAVIASPDPGAKVQPGSVVVRGYALAPGEAGRTIERVEVSADGGKNWKAGKLTSPRRDFCWQLWQAEVAVTASTQAILVRAIDSAGNMQPKEPTWNAKGYLFNAWHSVAVKVQ